MANNFKVAVATRNAEINAATALLNTGTIKIYDGTQPSTPETAVSTQTLLVTLTYGATAFGSASSNAATANAITSGTAVASSTATWARMLKSDGTTVVADCSVGSSGCDINLATAVINTNDTVSITSLTWTQP